MPYKINPLDKNNKVSSFCMLFKPIKAMLNSITPLKAKGNRQLQMEFEEQLKSLIYFHLEEHTSGRHLIQVLKEDEFARSSIAPKEGIEKSSFFEAINSRGLEQLMEVFTALQAYAGKILPTEHTNLGELIAIDGSLIDAVLSMK